MKRCTVILAVLALCLATAAVAAERKEVLLGITTDSGRGELAIEVVSTGCTKAEDFRFELKDGVLTVFRKVPDTCKAMPEKVRLTFKLRDIGLDPRKPFRLANEIQANGNLANIGEF